MKKNILTLCALCILLSGCTIPQSLKQSKAPSTPDAFNTTLDKAAFIGSDINALPDSLYKTYYLSSEESVHEYLQNKSIQKFFNMWVKYNLDENMEARWNYDSLAPVQFLDQKFNSIKRPGEEFYTCTFSTVDDRYGYIIVLYGEGEEGPYVTQWSLQETTPYLYDLRANSSQITAALKKTDIDLTTASAVRAEWIDTDKNRGDRIILFTDSKGGKYVCYFGDEDFTIEKQ